METILSDPLTKTINDSPFSGIFLDAAKVDVVTLIDEGALSQELIRVLSHRSIRVLSHRLIRVLSHQSIRGCHID